jgi:hypothetical protein
MVYTQAGLGRSGRVSVWVRRPGVLTTCPYGYALEFHSHDSYVGFMFNFFRYFIGLLTLVSALACLLRAQTLPVSGTGLDVDLLGNIYILNGEQNTLRLLAPDRRVLAEIGGGGWENSRFDRPSGIWARNGIDVFVADYGNHRVQRFDRGLTFVSSLSTRESSEPDQRFGYPSDVALSRMGELFICDTENQRIVKVNKEDRVELSIGGFDAGKGRLHNPKRLDIGPEDHLYVLDGPRVMVFDMFGNFLHELYQGIFTGPSFLFADAERVMVLDDSLLYCFDAAERPAGVVRIRSIPGIADAKIQAFSANHEKLFFLVEPGLVVCPNPCGGGEGDRIDKEGKSR